MRVMACPFCGLVSDIPHESQEHCITALQGEIARTRDLIDRVKQGPADPDPAGRQRDTAKEKSPL
jgi:hypothetical protein